MGKFFSGFSGFSGFFFLQTISFSHYVKTRRKQEREKERDLFKGEKLSRQNREEEFRL